MDQAPRKTVDTSNKDANVQGNIKNIIAVASGKGGVGKSTIALNLAAALSKAGHKTGLLDLDIYGPSLPITMGIVENPEVNDQQKIIPVLKDNLKLMSFGFISGNQAPVVWRGPLVAKMTEQFFRDVVWGGIRLSNIRSSTRYWRCSTNPFTKNSFRWSNHCNNAK